MALAADLLATPLSSGYSPSGTLSQLTAKLTSEIHLTETDTEDQFEAPSPCVERTVRRVQKKEPRSTTRRNFTIQEYFRVHNSPESPALGRIAAALSSTADVGQETEEHDSTVEDAESHNDENEQIEEGDHETSAQHTSDILPETTGPDTPAPAAEEPTLETPAFSPKKYAIHEIVQRVREAMTRTYKDEPGHAYILFERHGGSPFLKVGKSIKTSDRKGQHRRECQLETWDLKQRPATSIQRPMRLERLVQAELRNMVCDPRCTCGVKHQEYFRISKETGLELLDFWANWLRVHEPYDPEEELKPFWLNRLDKFQENSHRHFRCDSDECADQDEDTPACQACLRAGWKKWAEPTPSDELEYACQTNIPSKALQQIFQWLDRYGIIGVIYLMWLVQLIEQIVSLWHWISDPKIFHCALPLRLMAFWVKPQVSLPGQAGPWLLFVVDIALAISKREPEKGGVCKANEFGEDHSTFM
ncbi:hypothetical protein BDV06DRAFT_225716 [Aspergillus oleicola]